MIFLIKFLDRRSPSESRQSEFARVERGKKKKSQTPPVHHWDGMKINLEERQFVSSPRDLYLLINSNEKQKKKKKEFQVGARVKCFHRDRTM